MNRKQMIEFVNDKVLPGAEIDDWLSNGREIMWNILKGISSWRIGKSINVEMDACIKDGVLYINGESVKRVAPKLPRAPFDERAYYWEGRCLARAEY